MKGPNQTSLSEGALVLEIDEHGSEEHEGVANGVVEKKLVAEVVETADDCSKEQVPVALLEGKHAKGTNDAISEIKNSHSIGESDSNEKDFPRDKPSECADVSINRNFIFSPSWSESFKSPIGVVEFSPSENKSSHGLGKEDDTDFRYPHAPVVVTYQ